MSQSLPNQTFRSVIALYVQALVVIALGISIVAMVFGPRSLFSTAPVLAAAVAILQLLAARPVRKEQIAKVAARGERARTLRLTLLFLEFWHRRSYSKTAQKVEWQLRFLPDVFVRLAMLFAVLEIAAWGVRELMAICPAPIGEKLGIIIVAAFLIALLVEAARAFRLQNLMQSLQSRRGEGQPQRQNGLTTLTS